MLGLPYSHWVFIAKGLTQTLILNGFVFNTQVPVALLEYSMNAVTEGIDAIATTRVLIRGENTHTSTHALTGEKVHRTFRYLRVKLLSFFFP